MKQTWTHVFLIPGSLAVEKKRSMDSEVVVGNEFSGFQNPAGKPGDLPGVIDSWGLKEQSIMKVLMKGKMMHLLSRMDMYTLLILESSFRIAVWWHVSFSQISTNATCVDFWATPWGPSSFQVDSNLVSFKLRNRVLQEDDTYESLRMAPQVRMICGNEMRQLDNQSLILLFP